MCTALVWACRYSKMTASPRRSFWSTGTPIPAQWTCRRRCRDAYNSSTVDVLSKLDHNRDGSVNMVPAVCTCVYTHVYTNVGYTCVHTCVCTCLHICLYTCVCTCHVYAHVCARVDTQVCTHFCAHVDRHVFTHTRIHVRSPPQRLHCT